MNQCATNPAVQAGRDCQSAVVTEVVGRGMRRIVLSDYARQLAQQLQQVRAAEYEQQRAKQAAMASAVDERQREYAVAAKQALRRLRLLQAWQQWRQAARLQKLLCDIRDHRPMLQQASVEEMQAQAGSEAERRVDAFFASALGERWTLIAGYCGPGGEIDRILIGPWGVYAIEIKGNRGVIESDGQRWWVKRYGYRGDLLDIKTLPRAPDAQLCKAAIPLQRWLDKSGVEQRITTVVLFAAEDVRIGRMDSACADVVTTLDTLDLGLLFDPESDQERLTASLRERIVRLAVKDHHHWQSKRQRRRHAVPLASATQARDGISRTAG